MVKGTTETGLSEVLKKLSDIHDKINSQSALIDLQNKKLEAQTAALESQKLLIIEQKKVLETLLSTKNDDTPKPVTKTAKTFATATSKPKLTNASETRRSLISSSTITPLTTSERARRLADRNTKIANDNVAQPAVQTNKEAATKPAIQKRTAEIVTEAKSPSPTANDNEWQEVRHKRSKPRRSIVIGAGAEYSELKTVERIRHIQAWSFTPETTTENVKNFLNNITKHDEYEVLKRDILSKRHASFIIGIPESLYERLTSPTVWPPGVRFFGLVSHEAPRPHAGTKRQAVRK